MEVKLGGLFTLFVLGPVCLPVLYQFACWWVLVSGSD